ncbi:MAG TPA: GAF domain-containing protein [Crocinitomicaceae bacterium]|nr:GAF domain-containing protein [Crocinitomicaceae bacterium]
MSEELILNANDKKERYEELLPQLTALLEGETNLIANLANTVSALKMAFDFFWVGFYVVENEQLVLAPFQGPIACTRINYGKGVCGTAWKEKKTLVVPNVNEFAGHIACSSLSQSEIVVPVFKNGKIVAVLDVDSEQLSTFDAVDKEYLEKICSCISSYF